MLILCGLGTRFDQMTLETVHHLKTCGRILCVNLDAETVAMVRGSFGKGDDLRLEGDEKALEAALSGLAGEAQPSAVIVAGHPLLYGPGAAIASFCRRTGVSYRVLGALSSVDSALAGAEAALQGAEALRLEQGLSVVSAPDLLLHGLPLSAGSTTAVLNLFRLEQQFPGDAGVWRRLARRIEDCYGPGNPILLLEAESDASAGRWRRSTAAELPHLSAEITERTTLLLPALPVAHGTPALS